MSLESVGKILLMAGVGLVVFGFIFYIAGKSFGLSRFPGDLIFRRDGFTFYFPLGLSIAASVIATLLLNFFLRRGR